MDQRRAWIAWLVVLAGPLLFNAPVLLNVFKADPLIQFSGLATNVAPGLLAIHPYFDPSVGTIIQPLGRLSIEQLLHGQMPWWDPYEGVGSPLAGEMSPASFYPLNFLQLLPNGQTFVTVATEILSSALTFLLARRIGLGLFAGTVPALLFSCNGTFAWLGSGWCYPFPALPLLLLGVELCFADALRERVAGPVLIALAVAFELSGCMIEIAYFDTLFAIAWAIYRLACSRGAALFEASIRMLFGGVVGLLVAAPLLCAFFDDLKIGYVGSHTGIAAVSPLSRPTIGEILSPYILGPSFIHDSGYAGVAVTLFAVCGLFGAHRRPLRFLLGGWAAFAISAAVGVGIAEQILLAIPGAKYTAFNRYLDGSWEFPLMLLAGFFVYDLLHEAKPLRLGLRSAVASLIFPLGFLCFYPTAPGDFVTTALAVPGAMTWFWCALVWALVALSALWAIAGIRAFSKYRAQIVAGVVVFEAAANFIIPMLGNPTQATLNLGSVAFLRNTIGLQRVYSLGPLPPSYGSYFHIATLNDLELPVPAIWSDYEAYQLKSTTEADLAGVIEAISSRLGTYEDAAVRYIFMFRNQEPAFLSIMERKAKLAYADDGVALYELPHPAQYFSAPGCSIVAQNRTLATVQCTAPSMLTRRELFAPGWTATVNGAPVAIARADSIYQSIPLAVGTSTLTFSFVPPYMEYAYALFLAGAFALAYQIVAYVRLNGGWRAYASKFRFENSIAANEAAANQ